MSRHELSAFERLRARLASFVLGRALWSWFEVRRESHYGASLRKIRDEYGQVCEGYELCEHRSCMASYNAWAEADAALSRGRGD